jgi:hypothetical protein
MRWKCYSGSWIKQKPLKELVISKYRPTSTRDTTEIYRFYSDRISMSWRLKNTVTRKFVIKKEWKITEWIRTQIVCKLFFLSDFAEFNFTYISSLQITSTVMNTVYITTYVFVKIPCDKTNMKHEMIVLRNVIYYPHYFGKYIPCQKKLPINVFLEK